MRTCGDIYIMGRIKLKKTFTLFQLLTLFLNDQQMAFSVLEFSKIACHYLPHDVGGGEEAN